MQNVNLGSVTQSKAVTIICHDSISVFSYELPGITITISCTTLRHLLPVYVCCIYCNYLVNGTIFIKKIHFLRNVSFHFLYNIMKLSSFPEDFSKISLMYFCLQCLHVKCLMLLSDLTKYELLSHIVIQVPDIKFNENLSCGSHAVPRKWAAGQT